MSDLYPRVSETSPDRDIVGAFLRVIGDMPAREVGRLVEGVSADDVSRWRRGEWTRLSAKKRRNLVQYLTTLDGRSREETPEQAVAPNLPDVSYLKPQARALYERALGSYFTRRWPVPTIERATRELVQRIEGANTLRSRGPGRPELTEEEQAWILEDGIEEVERAYGPNGVARRY